MPRRYGNEQKTDKDVRIWSGDYACACSFNHAAVRSNPVFSGTVACQPRSLYALVGLKQKRGKYALVTVSRMSLFDAEIRRRRRITAPRWVSLPVLRL